MSQKKTLKELIKDRTALSKSREVVKPVDLYKDSVVSKQEAKDPSKQGLKKFSSYLRPDVIKNLKRISLEKDVKDYQALQDAVEAYIEKNKNLLR